MVRGACHRPLNSQERSEGTPAVVSVTSKHDVCVRQTVGKKRMDKKYAFDRVSHWPHAARLLAANE